MANNKQKTASTHDTSKGLSWIRRRQYIMNQGIDGWFIRAAPHRKMTTWVTIAQVVAETVDRTTVRGERGGEQPETEIVMYLGAKSGQ